eukprot:4290737-Pleurochrysis_carterae.AAC.9
MAKGSRKIACALESTKAKMKRSLCSCPPYLSLHPRPPPASPSFPTARRCPWLYSVSASVSVSVSVHASVRRSREGGGS